VLSIQNPIFFISFQTRSTSASLVMSEPHSLQFQGKTARPCICSRLDSRIASAPTPGVP
jgi:hypothetical protein